MGGVVTWLHNRNAYFEILMDSIYGSNYDSDDDFYYHGYGTFGTDDGPVGGYKGPKSKSRQTNKGGPSFSASTTTSEDIYRQLGGVTKLAADLYSMPQLNDDESFVHAAPSKETASIGRRSAVVDSSDLEDAYYNALTEVASTSPQYRKLIAERKAVVVDDGDDQESVNRRRLSSSGFSSSSKILAGRQESFSEIHPGLTAVATLVAFGLGLFVTKRIG
jgi:hypothetical protein